MNTKRSSKLAVSFAFLTAFAALGTSALGQLIDKSQAPNSANEGINKSYGNQNGAGRGDSMTGDSSAFIIARDPFRAIRRGRQLFQRKFTMGQGLGPRHGDGTGDVNTILAIGAGLADSCAACHGRPRGSAGFGGDVTTRPDSRDAPHLFGLGLKEMLADEITADLRAIRAQALAQAASTNAPVTRQLRAQDIGFGSITANPDGTVVTSSVQGVDTDLRVRPFFAHGGTISIREFVVGALNAEMGLQAFDPDLLVASSGGSVTTPSGMVLDGTRDAIEVPPVSNAMADPDGDGVVGEVPQAIVDYFEFYLLNYFKPGTYIRSTEVARGRTSFNTVGCAVCHVPDLRIRTDRRVADVETVFDEVRGNLNRLFSTATPSFVVTDDGSGHATLKRPALGPFVVRNIFTDFKRHDLGPNFHERNFDGTMQTQFLTTALWGVGSTPPYGHDGRSINLLEVILRHGGEALASRNAFAALPQTRKDDLIAFLNSLVLFPPDDTASNLDPGDRNAPGYPQVAHGSIKLGVLFNDSTDAE